MDTITVDVLVKILLFLKPSEVQRFALLSKYFNDSLSYNETLWKELSSIGIGKSLGNEIMMQIQRESLHTQQLQESITTTIASSSSGSSDTNSNNNNNKYGTKGLYRKTAQVLEGMQLGRSLKLQKLQPEFFTLNPASNQYTTISTSLSQVRMEGHAACELYSRYILILEGWGPNRRNDIHIYDGGFLPMLFKIPVKTVNCPPFKYGFTVVKAPRSEKKLYMYGGCTTGGYSGDCRALYTITLRYFIQPMNSRSSTDIYNYKNNNDDDEYDHDDIDCYGNRNSSNDDALIEITEDEMIANMNITTHRLSVVATYAKCNSFAQSSLLPLHQQSLAAHHPATANNNSNNNSSSSSSSTTTSSTTTSNNKTTPYLPKTRGYHSAIMMTINQRDVMVVYGGLHQHAPIGCLEIYDVESDTWHPVVNEDTKSSAAYKYNANFGRVHNNPNNVEVVKGKQPTPRFGHSCNFVGDNQLVFIGGSDGNDLLRNGKELREIHVLTIETSNNTSNSSNVSSNGVAADETRGDDQQQLSSSSSSQLSSPRNSNNKSNTAITTSTTTTFTWSSPSTNTPPFPRTAIPGRCHCSIQTGLNNSKIICFGGGAQNSNALLSVDFSELSTPITTPMVQLTTPLVYMSQPQPPFSQSSTATKAKSTSILNNIFGRNNTHSYTHSNSANTAATMTPQLPPKRTSAVSVRIGRYMIIHGGWSNEYRELGDIWLVDLALSTNDNRRLALDSCAISPEFKCPLSLKEVDPQSDDEEEDEEKVNNVDNKRTKLSSSSSSPSSSPSEGLVLVTLQTDTDYDNDDDDYYDDGDDVEYDDDELDDEDEDEDNDDDYHTELTDVQYEAQQQSPLFQMLVGVLTGQNINSNNSSNTTGTNTITSATAASTNPTSAGFYTNAQGQAVPINLNRIVQYLADQQSQEGSAQEVEEEDEEDDVNNNETFSTSMNVDDASNVDNNDEEEI